MQKSLQALQKFLKSNICQMIHNFCYKTFPSLDHSFHARKAVNSVAKENFHFMARPCEFIKDHKKSIPKSEYIKLAKE